VILYCCYVLFRVRCCRDIVICDDEWRNRESICLCSISISLYTFGMAFVQCLFLNKIIWNVVSVFVWNLLRGLFLSLSFKAQWIYNKVVSLFVLRLRLDLFNFFVCILFCRFAICSDPLCVVIGSVQFLLRILSR